MPILDRSPPTRASSGLPSSLLRFVSHDSPASVKRALEGTTRRSWEAVRTALGLRDASPPPCLFASARSSPRCSTASCDASREEEDANSAHGHYSGWFSEGFHSSRALANLLSARLDSVESDVAEAKRHLASLERWRRCVDASAELTSGESGDSEDAAFASRAEDSGGLWTRSARSSSSSRFAFSEALASEPSASRLSLVALVAAQTAAKRYENENATLVSSPSDSDLATRHRARGARLLHPSPPESPEEARSSDEYDFVRRDFERRVQTRGAASAESIDGSIDGSVDGSIDSLERVDDRDRSGLSRLIEDVREVRAEVARLKNAPFFAGADARLHSTRRVTGSSPY